MELWEIEARESVRDLVARYNANGDSGRIEQMVELFAEDAVMLIPPEGEYVGREAIRDFFGSIAKGTKDEVQRNSDAVRFIRHYTATHQIDVLDRDNAKGALLLRRAHRSRSRSLGALYRGWNPSPMAARAS